MITPRAVRLAAFNRAALLSLLLLTIAPRSNADPSGAAAYEPTDLEIMRDYAPPPAPERPLLGHGDDMFGVGMLPIRYASLAGSAGGVALTMWGIWAVSDSIGQGLGTVDLHRGLALAISGTVLSAVASSIYGMLKDRPAIPKE